MKKIGEIKGVPVVEGNINEVTKNQIHYKEDSGSIQLSKRGNDNKLNSITSGSSGSGQNSNIPERLYYKRIKPNDTTYDWSLSAIKNMINDCDIITDISNMNVHHFFEDLAPESTYETRLINAIDFTKVNYFSIPNKPHLYVTGPYSFVGHFIPNSADQIIGYYAWAIDNSTIYEINKFNECWKQITREEYESAITAVVKYEELPLY